MTCEGAAERSLMPEPKVSWRHLGIDGGGSSASARAMASSADVSGAAGARLGGGASSSLSLPLLKPSRGARPGVGAARGGGGFGVSVSVARGTASAARSVSGVAALRARLGSGGRGVLASGAHDRREGLAFRSWPRADDGATSFAPGVSVSASLRSAGGSLCGVSAGAGAGDASLSLPSSYAFSRDATSTLSPSDAESSSSDVSWLKSRGAALVPSPSIISLAMDWWSLLVRMTRCVAVKDEFSSSTVLLVPPCMIYKPQCSSQSSEKPARNI